MRNEGRHMNIQSSFKLGNHNFQLNQTQKELKLQEYIKEIPLTISPK